MKIRNKGEWLKVKGSGIFVDVTRDWPTIESLLESGFQGPVAIRYKQKDKLSEMGIPTASVQPRIQELVEAGFDQSLMYFCEWTPPETLVANCQAKWYRSDYVGGDCVDHDNLCLTFSLDKNIRVEQQYLEGREAENKIRRWIGEDGWQQLLRIWAVCPDATIEFTAHNIRLGPRMMFFVIWEVRDY